LRSVFTFKKQWKICILTEEHEYFLYACIELFMIISCTLAQTKTTNSSVFIFLR
jgi:hypothetical protein